MTQEEINTLLVTLAQKGARVVRLKGGDPLMFGRGSEEALALRVHHIRYEIIPGITSAQGCAAYAGIPLTHRGLATGVRFITGHRTSENADAPLDLDWQGLVDPDTTLVVYMGLANIDIIATQLIAHGLPASTPAAAIEQGTTPSQRVISTTLADLPAQIKQAVLEAPVLVVIGKVAAFAEELAWFTGKTA